MANAFSTIGVPIGDSEDDYRAWAERAAAEGQAVPVAEGEYRILSSNAGAQLWAAVDRRGRVIALTPHYAGTAVIRARLTDRIKRAEESRFEGAFDGWTLDESPASPADSSCDASPLLFDVPDAMALVDLLLPALADVHIAAFAHECRWHADVETFEAAQESADLPLAEEAFVYVDVFAENPERDAIALLSARIADTAVRVNELTGLGFRWASARTLIGAIEIIADPTLVEGEPTAGGVVEGTFWLSGRIGTVHAQDQARHRPRRRRWPLGR